MKLKRHTLLKASAPAITFSSIIPASTPGKNGHPAPSERITFGSIERAIIPGKEKVIGDQEADKLLKVVDYRKPGKPG
jgi:hypothetical protein